MASARILRPALALTGLLAVLTALAMPAGAQTTTQPTYKVSAKATGLDLQVLGQGITLGFSHSEAGSDPVANATGVGLLLPGLGNQGELNASATADGQSNGTPAPGVCGPLSLPPDVPLIDLSTACSSAVASISGGVPSSIATAQVASIDVNALDVLKQLPLSDITTQVQPLLDGLKQVFDQLDTTGIDANTLISTLLQALNQSGDIVRVTLGPTSASATGEGGSPSVASALASAQGTVVELLPRDLLNLAPVVKIEVGAASNSISVNRDNGEATVQFDPALVKITLAPDIAAALPDQFPNPISLAPGQNICLPLPPPLQSCIIVGAGSQTKLDDGTTHAEAAGVSLQLATGLPGGGVQLSLANTVVEGRAVGVEAERQAPPAEEPPLARTGGSTDAALVGVLLALAAVAYLLNRSTRRREELELR